MKLSDLKHGNVQTNNGNAIEYLQEKMAGGLVRSVEGLGDFFIGGAQYLTGNKDAAIKTFTEDWMNYSHADEWFNPSGGWKIAGDAASGIGNSMLSLATAGVGGLAQKAGVAVSSNVIKALSYSALGLSAAGNATGEAVKKTGDLGGREFGYGVLAGGTEVLTEMLGDKLIPDAGTGGIRNALANSGIVKNTTNALTKSSAGRIIASLVKDFSEEALEEGISEIVDPLWLKATGIDPEASTTPQDVFYAALIGGLSGVVMGGVHKTTSAASQLIAGTRAINNGTADSIISTAKTLSEKYQANDVEGDLFGEVDRAYTELADSLKQTDGQIKTSRQRMLVGFLSKANAAAVLSPMIATEMMNIANHAEEAARSASAFMTDENGNRIEVTPEQIREGLKGMNDYKNIREYRRDVLKAAKNNKILTSLAVASFAGKLGMQTNAYMKYMAENPDMVDADSLNMFIEQSTDAEKKAYGEILGVKDWKSATASKVSEAIRNNGDKLNAEISRQNTIKEKAKGQAKPAPNSFSSKTADGVYDIGDGYVAVKEGNAYTIVNKNSGHVSTQMDAKQANNTLERYRTGKAEAEENRYKAEADAFAKEHIEDWDKLSESVKRSVRMTIRQADEAKGISEEEKILCAQLVAKTGLNIIFDEKVLETTMGGKVTIGNGMYDLSNTIYINPKSSRTQTVEDVLNHETAHWILNNTNPGVFESLSFEGLKDGFSKKFNNTFGKYYEFYKDKGKSKDEIIQIILDEINSAYAEEIMGNTKLLNVLMENKPSKLAKIGNFARGLVEKLKGIDGVGDTGKAWLNAMTQGFYYASAVNKGRNAFTAAMKNRDKILGRYNVAYEQQHTKDIEENYDPKEATQKKEAILEIMARAINIWNDIGFELNSKFLNEWNAKKGKDGNFQVFKEQAGYKYNAELSTMCKKGVPLFEAIDAIVRKEIMKQIDSDMMGKEEKQVLYDVLKEHGFEIPCAICYVEQARQREGRIINNFLNGTDDKIGWNTVLRQIEKLMAEKGVQYKFEEFGRDITADGYEYKPVSMNEEQSKAYYEALMQLANDEIKKSNETAKTKRALIAEATPAAFAKAFKGNLPTNLKLFRTLAFEQNSRRTIGKDMLYSSYTTANLAANHQQLYSLFNVQGGTGGYKTKQKPIIYTGEILGKQYKASQVRLAGGIRNQSNSDLQMYLLMDMIQMYADLAAKGYYLHAYTKVVAELKLFGLCGSKINASLIPSVHIYYNEDGTVDVGKTMENAGLDENGEPLYDDFEGINADEAFMLISDPEYSKNICGICIGYSDKHILKLLDDKRVQLIIGFHDTTNDPMKRYRGAKYANNYRGNNEAKDKNGKTQQIGFSKYLNEAEKAFGYDVDKNTHKKTSYTFEGKTYAFDDIPKLAADMYKSDLRSKGYTQLAYEQFSNHENYYKLLADFGLYNSEGHYAPQRKVNLVLPETVKNLQKDGSVKEQATKDYIQALLKAELETMDKISAELEDTSEGGIIPQVVQRINALPKNQQSDTVTADGVMSISDADYMALAQKENKTKEDYQQLEQMVREAAKANGYNKKVYHGTRSGIFYIFDMSKDRDGNNQMFFSSNRKVAESYGKDVMSLYINTHNFLTVDAGGDWWSGFDDIITKRKAYDKYMNTLKSLQDKYYEYFEQQSKAKFGTKEYNEASEKAQQAWLEYEKYRLESTDGEDYLSGSTNSMGNYAIEHGYDGVIIKNVVDPGNENVDIPSTVYIIFEPNRVKSADPVTYDNGKIIPLSQRFSPSNDDIRWSLPDADYMKAVDSNDMETAQKMVDEAAKNAGYTMLATHRTDADFTVFNKSSRSGRNGKTLGDAFYVAKTKKEWEGTPIHTMYDTDTYGKNRMLLYVNPGNTLDLANGLSEREANKVYDKYFAPFHEDKFGTYRPHVIDKLQDPSRLVDYIEEAAKNLDTTTDEVFKWLGYDSVKDGVQYALFDANQMKSADPVTYDDQGNVIPLSERFNDQNDDIRYSLPDGATGINIRADKEAGVSYVDEILNGMKTYETRTNTALNSYVGKRVGLVETGNGQATLKGYATIGKYDKVWKTYEAFRKDYDLHRIPEGSEFDMKPGEIKYGYPISNVERIDEPKPLTSKGIVARDARYSLPATDSDGNKLSAEQREFFKDSKVVDENGNLLVVYHGTTRSGFTKFIAPVGRGVFFSNKNAVAAQYAWISENQVIHPSKVESFEHLRDALEQDGAELAIRNNKYEVTFDGETRTFNSLEEVTKLLWDEFLHYDFDIPGVYEVYLNITNPLVVEGNGRAWNDLDGKTTDDYVKEASKAGYDGVIFRDIWDGGYERGDVYVVFSPEQIKDTYNTKPTSDPDMRYSLPDNIEELAVKKFGTTEKFGDAGFILKDGRMLDFSSSKQEWSGRKVMWHHNILFAADENNNNLSEQYAAVNAFVHRGNIRVNFNGTYQHPAILHLPSASDVTNLTDEQYAVIDKAREDLHDGLIVGFDDEQHTRLEYSYRTIDSLIDDINNYYRSNGNRKSDLALFHSDTEEAYQYALYSLANNNESKPDEETQKWLEKQATTTVYRAMQVIDGKLYPPMAAKVKGENGSQLVQPSEIGEWEQAVEHPELIQNNPAGKPGYFKLDKGNGSSILARYNPYFHTSRIMLNDQFSSASKRPNLVVVEGEVPTSELTSGYKAQYAKDSVGEMSWHSGPVAGKLPKSKTRKVILSRWFKPVRILTDAEVADSIVKLLEGENITIPENVVTPGLREELAKRGLMDGDVRMSIPDNMSPDGKVEYLPDGKVISHYYGKEGNVYNSEFEARYALPNGQMSIFDEDYIQECLKLNESDSEETNKLMEGRKSFVYYLNDNLYGNSPHLKIYNAALGRGIINLHFPFLHDIEGNKDKVMRFLRTYKTIREMEEWDMIEFFLNPEQKKPFGRMVNEYLKEYTDEHCAVKVKDRELPIKIHRSYFDTEVAEQLYNCYKVTDELDPLAKEVFDLCRYGQVEWYFSTKVPAGVGGQTASKRVYVNLPMFENDAESLKHKAIIILHEAIHAATNTMLILGEDYEDKPWWSQTAYYKEESGYADEINDIRLMLNKAKGAISRSEVAGKRFGDKWYGLKDINELMAELANPAFRSAINQQGLTKQMSEVFAKIIDELYTAQGRDQEVRPNPSNYLEAVEMCLEELMRIPYYYSSEQYAEKAEETNYRYRGEGKMPIYSLPNNIETKHYTQKEIDVLLNDILTSISESSVNLETGEMWTAKLRGKTRKEVLEFMAKEMNKATPSRQSPIAFRIADYIIDRTIMQEVLQENLVAEEMATFISLMDGFRHKINMRWIKDEIKYRYDDKQGGMYLQWAAKKGENGISPDVIAKEFAGMNIPMPDVDIDGAEQDIFYQLMNQYKRYKAALNEKAREVKLREFKNEEGLKAYRQSIVKDVMLGLDEKGTVKKSIANFVKKYEDRISELEDIIRKSAAKNHAQNRALDLANQLKEYAKHKYKSSSVLADPLLDAWAKQLGKLVYRGDLRKANAREILSSFGTFYNINNNMLVDWYKENGADGLDENVLGAISMLKENLNAKDKSGQVKPLTYEEMRAAEVILGCAVHLYKTFDTTFFEGKRVKTAELADMELALLEAGGNRAPKGAISKLLNTFIKYGVEPRVVFKMLEHYDSKGILTRILKDIQDGETAAANMRMMFLQPFEEFFKKNKKYGKRLTEERVNIFGEEMTIGQAMTLYELTKREQAWLGLVNSGFAYEDADGNIKHWRGERKAKTTQEAESIVLDMQKEIFKHFTRTDQEFLSWVEFFFNVSSKNAKYNADIEMMGYSNVADGFYFPINRESSTIARSTTSPQSFLKDIAALNNMSFNKDTKKNAQTELRVGDVYEILTRHARQMSMYANLSLPMQTFDRVYNKNMGTPNDVRTVKKYIAENVWDGADPYFMKLMSDVQGVTLGIGDVNIFGKLRGAFAKYQLGLNAKVILSQTASLPTAASILSWSSIAKGLVHKIDFKAMDKYCDLAKVRNFDQTIVKAEGVIDKVEKFGNMTTKPIQWTDRLTIGLLWNACQASVEKTQGLKYGTEENMKAAGKLLDQVIRETQPNYSSTERSALMRSNSELIKSITMFTSAPLKQYSRFAEFAGELMYAIKTKNKAMIAGAGRKLRKAIIAILMANLMYCMIGQLFTWLYNKKRTDKNGNEISFSQDYFTDVATTTAGMIPVANQLVNYLAKGYDVSGLDYEMINDFLDTANAVPSLVVKAISGEKVQKSDIGSAARRLIYTTGELTGIPTRNVMNTIMGLFSKFSPEAAYSANALFYNQNYKSDLKKYIEEGNEGMASYLLDLYMGKGGALTKEGKEAIMSLYSDGYDVLPRIPNGSLTYTETDSKGNESSKTISLNAEQQRAFSQANATASEMVNKAVSLKSFKALTEESQAKAVRAIYNAYYNEVKDSVTGQESSPSLVDYFGDDVGTYATVLAGMNEIEADKDKNGNPIPNSRKKKVYAYLTKSGLTKGQVMYVMAIKGYSLKNLGVSETTAKRMVLQIIMKLNVSKEEKAAIAEKCGFTVKNGRIITK